MLLAFKPYCFLLLELHDKLLEKTLAIQNIQLSMIWFFNHLEHIDKVYREVGKMVLILQDIIVLWYPIGHSKDCKIHKDGYTSCNTR